MVQQLHLNGPGAVQCLDPLTLENSFVDKDLTFGQRMAIFVDVCRFRKSRVCLMLDGSMLDRYVLMTSTILSGSETNALANAKRAAFIKDGRSVWETKNPDKAGKKKQGGSNHGNRLTGGGLSTEGQNESRDEEQSGK
jgi:hypothetical protein